MIRISPDFAAADVAAIVDAAEMWRAATGMPEFQYEIQDVGVWAPETFRIWPGRLEEHVLGKTWTHNAASADIVVDTAKCYVDAADLKVVVGHELGHAFGLAHEMSVPSIMAPSIHGTNHSDTVTVSDVSAFLARGEF